MAAPPAPVMVSPRMVTKRDCRIWMACPAVHWLTAPCSTTPPTGADGSAWITIRVAGFVALEFSGDHAHLLDVAPRLDLDRVAGLRGIHGGLDAAVAG